MDYVSWGDLLFHMKQIKKQKQIDGKKGGTFTENEAKFIVVWILEGLRVLHGAGIVHRDVKPDNIIMDTNGYPKLADLGVAEQEQNIKEGSQFGTLSYMAPEVIFGHAYSYQADYYSLGVLLLLMVTGDMLSVGKNIKEAKVNIALRRDSLTTKRFWKRYPELSQEWNDLIVQLITTSQHQRIGAKGHVDEILEHEWFMDVDVDKIVNQTLESPILQVVTDPKNIDKLTEITNNKFTNYWEKKERKALKLLGKTFIDDGEYFKSEFDEFIKVNVEETDSFTNTRDSMMVIRRHTMSSIRKRKEMSLSMDGATNSVLSDDSPLENVMSAFSEKDEDEIIENEGEQQSGIVSEHKISAT